MRGAFPRGRAVRTVTHLQLRRGHCHSQHSPPRVSVASEQTELGKLLQTLVQPFSLSCICLQLPAGIQAGSAALGVQLEAGGMHSVQCDVSTSLVCGETSSSCTRTGLDLILGKMYSLDGWSGFGTSCPRNCGITIPGTVQKSCGCGTRGHSLVVNSAGLMVGLDELLEFFSNPNYAVILRW